jgi:hypothetical protein
MDEPFETSGLSVYPCSDPHECKFCGKYWEATSVGISVPWCNHEVLFSLCRECAVKLANQLLQ